MRPRSYKIAATFLAVSFLSTACVCGHAQAEPIEWQVGAGAAIVPDYEGSEDYEWVPIGMFRVDLKRESFIDLTGAKGSGRAARLRYNVVADSLLLFGPMIQFRRGRGNVENDQVDAMKNIDDSLELGGFFGFDEQGWYGGIAVAADVSDGYNGVFAEGTLGYKRALTPWLTAGTNAVLTWGSDGYMKTFFGVTASDSAKSGLEEYDVDSDFKDAGGQVFAQVSLPGIEGLGLLGVFSYYRLMDKAGDSPVVDEAGDADQLFGGLMLTYSR
jgi:outer membrane scaffolding protein for murein synthesis (MipA/OmpV family)